MADWDVFHSDRLEAERSLTDEDVRAGLARGEIVEDDLIRPAGSSRWTRVGDSEDFADLAAGPAPPLDGGPASSEVPLLEFDEDDPPGAGPGWSEVVPGPDVPAGGAALGFFEIDDEEEDEPAAPDDRAGSSLLAAPALPDDQTERPDLAELDDLDFEPEEFDPQDDDEEAAEFTLSRNSADRVEELDLAAMVDVAFQLVLFFLVTASTVVFKTLEIPRPNDDKPPEAAAQARTKSIEELEKDYILVEVDAAGALKVDRQPVAADRAALAERLRAARQATGRKAMLLSADFATRHENAVMAFDVANEVELAIAIAQPAAKK